VARYFEEERECEQCRQSFWGTAKANFCSTSCRARRWRADQSLRRSRELADLCAEVLRRRSAESASWSKLMPRLFRAVAAELRRNGWDPIELLLDTPDEPAMPDDTAPGGIDGAAPRRRRWLHPPDVELAALEKRIAERQESGLSTRWHEGRRAQLLRALMAKSPA
jgi:hypothetical protein